MASFAEYDAKIKKLNSFLENCQNDGPTARSFYRQITETAKEKLDLCVDGMNKADALYEEGVIDETYHDEVIESLTETFNDIAEVAYGQVYTEAVTLRSAAIAADEVAKITHGINTFIPAGKIGELLTIPAKKFILSRLNRYTLLHPDCISFKQLSVERYAMDEVVRKFHVKSSFAEKWEGGAKKTNCKVYFYNKKPVMLVAYYKQYVGARMSANIETVFLDSKFQKHDDYYVACMTCALQMSHPAIRRVLSKLEEDWKKENKRVQKLVKESVEEAVKTDSFDEMLSYVTEAAEVGFIEEYDIPEYKKFLTDAYSEITE